MEGEIAQGVEGFIRIFKEVGWPTMAVGAVVWLISLYLKRPVCRHYKKVDDGK